MSIIIPEEYDLNSYIYKLPGELIAQFPANDRDASRLLCFDRNTGLIEHKNFTDLPDYFSGDEILVLNESRVIQARLHGFKETGGSVELLVISEIDRRSFRAMFRAKRGLKPGATIKIFSDSGDGCFILKCRSVDSQGYAVIDIENTEIVNLLQRAGKMPVPPYIKRNDSRFDAMDSERYQTVYARIPGSVAAPTAGLHFTERILSALRKKGVKIVRVCLHVGPGTFKPVRNNDVRKHNIDGEYFSIDSDTAAILNEAISRKKPVAAVGTTTVRTLESAYWDGAIQPGNGISDLFIFPGYKFRVVNRMITNFHLPQSSLLLLVSAFTGREKILSAYREAIEKKYRFYSYGDCMLII